jgi:hypothetical protein
MKFLAGIHGPCITMVVPARHPGAQDGSGRVLVNSLIRTAREGISRAKFAAQADELLAPLEEIARGAAVESGGSAFVIFRSPEYLARYEVPNRATGKVVIGDRFHLVPFVKDAFARRDFLVLGLSKKHLRLFRYVSGECSELPLPAGVPPTLEAAGGFDKPEHNLENRSTAGSSTGTMRAVRFGTGTDREAAGEYLHHFFVMVDRGLTAAFGNKALLLLGVREEIAEYRRTAKHALILNSDVPGNVDFLSTAQIGAFAAQAADNDYELIAERILAEFRETPDRDRTLADTNAVLHAANEGRVHRLCVRTEAEAGSPDSELLNAAVVDTLRTGADVFMVPQEKLPAANPLAAILRY